MPNRTLIHDLLPTEEPVSLTEAKGFLRVDVTDDDVLIERLITAARKACESYTKRSFITQRWKLVFEEYAPEVVALERGPVQAMISVKTLTEDATETSLSSESYTLSPLKETLRFKATPMAHRVELLYEAGYGNQAAVPAPIKQAILVYITALYDNRSGAIHMPAMTRELLNPYRIVRV